MIFGNRDSEAILYDLTGLVRRFVEGEFKGFRNLLPNKNSLAVYLRDAVDDLCKRFDDERYYQMTNGSVHENAYHSNSS